MNRTRSVAEAVAVLRAGGTVVVPTDTAYALAADATNATAVAQVKRLKGRDVHKPIAAIAADLAQVRKYFVLPRESAKLARRFWPGPLTIVLQPKPPLSRSGLSRGGIGVRVPANAAARRIARLLDAPITATSANRSGGPTPYSVPAALRQFRARTPDGALNAGALRRRPVSTVVRFRRGRAVVLRPGAIPEATLHVVR